MKNIQWTITLRMKPMRAYMIQMNIRHSIKARTQSSPILKIQHQTSIRQRNKTIQVLLSPLILRQNPWPTHNRLRILSKSQRMKKKYMRRRFLKRRTTMKKTLTEYV